MNDDKNRTHTDYTAIRMYDNENEIQDFVTCCFQPSQPLRIISRLCNENTVTDLTSSINRAASDLAKTKVLSASTET